MRTIVITGGTDGMGAALARHFLLASDRFAAVRLRRLELAGALHVGVSRRALLAQTALETVLWSAAGLVLVVCALAVAVRVGNPADPWETFAVSAPAAAAAGAAALAGAVAAVSLVREEHLFRYFKDR